MNTCTFGPGIPDTCLAHATPWYAPLGTESPLWAYLAGIAFVAFVSWSASWLKDHYELSGRRPVRRWYGAGARVILRSGENARRYAVLAWDGGDCAVPWLKVHQLVPESRFWDEDAETFWVPVTIFAPHSVRRLHPHLRRGWLPVLFAHETFQGDPS